MNSNVKKTSGIISIPSSKSPVHDTLPLQSKQQKSTNTHSRNESEEWLLRKKLLEKSTKQEFESLQKIITTCLMSKT